jgi:hypothetical protein
VSRVLRGVEVIPTFVDYRDKPTGSEIPACVIFQQDEASTSPSGALSGDVTLRFHYSPAIHRGLDEDTIVEAARRMGFEVEAMGRSRTPCPGTDVLNLRVRSAFGDTPAIPVIDSNQIQSLGRSLANDLALAMRYDGHAVMLNPRTGATESSHIVALPYSHDVVSNEIDANGERTLTIDSAVHVRVKHALSGRSLDETILEVVDNQGQSKFHPSLGVAISCERVTESKLSVEHHKVSLTLNQATDVGTDAHTLIGYIDGADHQIITRTTLRSSAHVVRSLMSDAA